MVQKLPCVELFFCRRRSTYNDAFQIFMINGKEYFTCSVTYSFIKIMDSNEPELLKTVGTLPSFPLLPRNRGSKMAEGLYSLTNQQSYSSFPAIQNQKPEGIFVLEHIFKRLEVKGGIAVIFVSCDWFPRNYHLTFHVGLVGPYVHSPCKVHYTIFRYFVKISQP